MSTTMYRCFLPVGQGAFYLEHFTCGKTVVYDCGSNNKRQLAEQVNLLAAQKEINQIDYVFFSHLHQDHFNGLKLLLANFTIKTIVLPYLAPATRYFMAISSRLSQKSSSNSGLTDLNNEYEHFLADPISFIHEQSTQNNETSIIFVYPEDSEISRNDGMSTLGFTSEFMDGMPFRYAPSDQLPAGTQMIPSGFRVTLAPNSKNAQWQYIPFNCDYANKKNALWNALKQNGLISLSDVDQALQNGDERIIIESYEKSGLRKNASSMAVYSGPHLPRQYSSRQNVVHA